MCRNGIRSWVVTFLAAAILFWTGGLLRADNGHEGKAGVQEIKELVSKCKITLAKAIEIAEAATQGRAYGVECELEDGRVEIEVKVLVGDVLKEVEIDGADGKVLEIETKQPTTRETRQRLDVSKLLGRPREPDRHFFFTDTEDGISLSAEAARNEMREAAKANPGQPPMIRNPKTGKYTGVFGLKCPKCGTYFSMQPKTGSMFPTSWRDICPKCGYSEQREQAIQAAIKMHQEGKYDPERIPPFMREDIEKALRERDAQKK